MSDSRPSTLHTLASLVRDWVSLYLENARLTAAEKLSLLLSAIALYSLAMMLGMVALVFITMGIANLLAAYIAPFWTYLIIGGVFVAMTVILFIFRCQLLINPIARFISRLIVKEPESEE